MRVAICVAIKNENRYIKEWLDYHRNLGFDNIVIYDNNDSNGENLYEVIGEDIESGFVIYEEIKDRGGIQLECFNNFLTKYRESFDWVLFNDCDEFVFMNNHKNIHSWLNQEKFNDAYQILLKFKNYGDNDILNNDGNYSVLNNYVVPFNEIETYEPFNVKTFINLQKHKNSITFEKESHFVNDFYDNTFNADGKKILPCAILFDECECELKHYKTKSIGEYVERHKSDVYFKNVNVHLVSKKMKTFFNINNINKEKIKIVQDAFDWWTPAEKIYKIDVVLNSCKFAKYTIKSILRNLPFIRKIFLIVDKKNTDNYFIDERIVKIEKKEFVHEEFCNVVNNDHALFLHNIEELSEHFIYVYDGTIFNYICNIEEFFRDGSVCMTPTNITKVSKQNKKICVNNTLLYLESNVIEHKSYAHNMYNFGYMYSEVCCPMLKSINRKCFNHMEEYIKKYIIKECKKINHWIYPMWYKNIFDTCNFIHTSVKIDKSDDMKKELLDPIYKIINISSNDANEEIFKILDNKYKNNMKVAICVTVKNENRYLSEWVDYHYKLGFDNIILYDNNDSDGEDVFDVIGDNIHNGFIMYENVKDKKQCQLQCYNECLQKYCKEFEWILFIDCDEFIELNNFENIHSCLYQEKFNEFDQLLINSSIYTDNDLLFDDGSNVTERFKIKKESFIEDNICQVKAFIKTKNYNDKFIFKTKYFVELYDTTCDINGDKIFPSLILFTENNDCIVKHYQSKTINEYIKRHSCNCDNIQSMAEKLNKFFVVNKNSLNANEKISMVKKIYPWYNNYNNLCSDIDIVIVEDKNPFFEYTLKSIENNISWFNKIFVITSKCIINDNVICVNPKDIIPNGFEKCDIGLFLHNIKNLSDRFIYIYNGTIFNYPCFEEEFFNCNKICMQPSNFDTIPKAYKKICYENNKLYLSRHDITCDNTLRVSKGNFGYMFSRTCCPMLKDDNRACFDILKENIKDNKDKINHFIYPIWSRLMCHTFEFIHTNVSIDECEDKLLEVKDPIHKIINIPLNYTNEDIVMILNERYGK